MQPKRPRVLNFTQRRQQETAIGQSKHGLKDWPGLGLETRDPGSPRQLGEAFMRPCRVGLMNGQRWRFNSGPALSRRVGLSYGWWYGILGPYTGCNQRTQLA
ncbi:hypothetical protein BJY04DRAFT_184297 [Aspergillus karnatakaensis]|uniref:uncharacterized protein n=1 Tax=Aspergillus karnatakaensis TaxID=1810916 RepID=UPI003CCCB264